jgi:CubicO group peptidase (beta-lactamase class C family)
MAEVDGTCHDAFAGVRDAFERNFVEQGDVGASVAVTVEGEVVVDLWGGTATPVGGGPERGWAHDTLINVWSTTKTMAALTVLLLADRDDLDLDAPVARYWPEFAAAGKGGVLVRHVLAHTAGLPGFAEPVTMEDLVDHEKVCSLLAAQEPWWEPGSASGYHAITQGYLEGELVRRITGSTLGAVFASEIAGPLGADFHIGTGPEHDGRVVQVIAPETTLTADAADPSSIAYRTLTNPAMDASFSSSEAWRRAEVPAANGHGNARSVATILAIVANEGTVGRATFVGAGTIGRIFEEQSYTTDLVLGLPLRLGIGYGLTSPDTPLGPNPRTWFWGGWGGSLALVDVDARMSVAYVMNKMGEGTVGDLRGAGVAFAAHAGRAVLGS